MNARMWLGQRPSDDFIWKQGVALLLLSPLAILAIWAAFLLIAMALGD